MAVLGYAERTTNESVSSETDLTGLTVTVDVPAGRRLRVSASVSFSSATSGNQGRLFIKEGTTYLKRANSSEALGTDSSAFAESVETGVILTPSAGSHTYKLAISRNGSSTVTMRADVEKPAFILVEDLGAA